MWPRKRRFSAWTHERLGATRSGVTHHSLSEELAPPGFWLSDTQRPYGRQPGSGSAVGRLQSLGNGVSIPPWATAISPTKSSEPDQMIASAGFSTALKISRGLLVALDASTARPAWRR